jgi:hypothetical protein
MSNNFISGVEVKIGVDEGENQNEGQNADRRNRQKETNGRNWKKGRVVEKKGRKLI